MTKPICFSDVTGCSIYQCGGMIMLCDVCNTPINEGEGERISPDIFSYLLDNGFGIAEESLSMLMDVGMSRDQAISTLKEQYRQMTSDWLLCEKCAAEAGELLSHQNEQWISSDYIAVTRTAESVGLGFDILGGPVALSRPVWEICVQWGDDDSGRQTYQEKDARLWDILFTGGGTLQIAINSFLRKGIHKYSVLCVPRNGVATEAETIFLTMRPHIIRDQSWLVIEKDDQCGDNAV